MRSIRSNDVHCDVAVHALIVRKPPSIVSAGSKYIALFDIDLISIHPGDVPDNGLPHVIFQGPQHLASTSTSDHLASFA